MENQTEEDKEYFVKSTCRYCEVWDVKSSITLWIGLLIPLIMGIGDVLVEEIVKCFSRCKKPKNETKFLIDSILAIMWI